MFQDNQVAIEDALLADLGKPRQESSVAEISPVIGSAVRAAAKLEEWTKPVKPEVEEWRSSWDTTIYKVPKGVALIISCVISLTPQGCAENFVSYFRPWNYPWILTFNPLVGAIAAGCPVVLKPSESVPASAALMKELVERYLDPQSYVVVNGAVPETTALLNHRWDHIFFTGGGKIGKIIATIAAQNLTPVTL